MVALNVTDWSTDDGFGDAASVTEVAPEPTSCETGDEVLLAKLASPEV
jgi:hypothetical protein